MSDLSETQREALHLLTEGDDLSCLDGLHEVFAYGVALGLYLATAPPPSQVEGDYQEAIRPMIDDCQIEVADILNGLYGRR